jgi:hypothetical protein
MAFFARSSRSRALPAKRSGSRHSLSSIFRDRPLLLSARPPEIRRISWDRLQPNVHKRAGLKPARIGSKARGGFLLPFAALQSFDAKARGGGKRIVAKQPAP